MSAEVREFEMKVLRYVARNNSVTLGGKGKAAIVSAARRLEKKGLLYKNTRWGVTQAGRDYLKSRELPRG